MIPNNIRETERKVFTDTVDKIVKVVDPEKIICFGCRIRYNEEWSNFLDDGVSDFFACYDLLIITKDSDPRKEYEILDRIVKYNRPTIQIIAVAQSIKTVHAGLRYGDRFYTVLFHRGTIVYDSSGVPLPAPNEVGHQVVAESADRRWNRTFGLGKRFFQSAVHAFGNDNNDVAVFMLHQAVERICSATIMYHIGYHLTTHSLDKLFRLLENFTLEGTLVFPRISNEEIVLFDALARGYGDTRYKATYNVSPETVRILVKRVRKLIKAFKRLHDSKENSNGLTVQVRKFRETQPFESVRINTFANVVLVKGEQSSVRIESKKGGLDMLAMEVENKRLWVSDLSNDIDTLRESTLYLTYTGLNGIVVNHVGNLTCTGPVETAWLGVVQNSTGQIRLELEVMSLDLTISKSGSVIASGSVDEVAIQVYGSGDFIGSALQATDAKVRISGSGSVFIHTQSDLTADLQGSGDLYYKGTPSLKSFMQNGTGTIKPLEETVTEP